jgi:hypothetical protein
MRYVTYLNIKGMVSKDAVDRAKTYRDEKDKGSLSIPALYDLLKGNDKNDDE